MTGTLVFDPLLPWLVLYAALGLAALGVAVALWRGLAGWWLRGLWRWVCVPSKHWCCHPPRWTRA